MDVEEKLLFMLATDVDQHFEQLMSAYQLKLYRYVYAKVGNHDSTKDIVQNTFINAYKALTTYSALEIQLLKLRPWLFTIARNLAINHLEKVRRDRLHLISTDLPDGRDLLEETEGGLRTSPEIETISKEENQQLYDCISQLPEVLQTPVILHYILGHSYPEVAKLLKKPLNTVKSDGRRGLQKLRALLGEI